MRCSYHLFPDSPSFGNQTLRYWLGMDIQLPPAHRALSDALVTASLFQKMLTMKSVDELVVLTTTPVCDFVDTEIATCDPCQVDSGSRSTKASGG